jgi:hypothetical protein
MSKGGSVLVSVKGSGARSATGKVLDELSAAIPPERSEGGTAMMSGAGMSKKCLNKYRWASLRTNGKKAWI